MKTPKVQLLLTGNELMTGDIVDSNSAMMAELLKDIGLGVLRKVTIADDIALLVNEISVMANMSDILIINGGLGPTVDDLTAQALALATEDELSQHPLALTHLKAWCKKRGAQLNTPNLKQTILPKKCQVIANKNGSAVGIHVNYNNCDIYCTPGVPHELKTMLIEEIIPAITANSTLNKNTDITRMQVFGLGESNLQTLIDQQLPDWPTEIELGFRAGKPLLEVKLTTETPEALLIKPLWKNKLKHLLGDHIIEEVNGAPKGLAEHLLNALQKDKLKITTAESCTGGLIASKLTEVSGSSASFEAGFVTYSNEMKTNMLNVPSELFQKEGAVCETVVIAMLTGALKKANADIGIAVSGIAGPNGGTTEKPVGTVWLAWGSLSDIKTVCLLVPHKRRQFQQYVTAVGLDLLRRYHKKLDSMPAYILEKSIPKKTKNTSKR